MTAASWIEGITGALPHSDGCGWRHLRRRCVTLPACRQDAIRIGLLLADIAAVDPLLRTAADPGDAS